MHHKHNKLLAKSVGHGIANTVTQNKEEAQLQADASVYAIQEVANAMQQQQDKKFEQMMQLFQTMLQMQGNGNKMQGNTTMAITMEILPMHLMTRSSNTPNASTAIVGTRRMHWSAGS